MGRKLTHKLLINTNLTLMSRLRDQTKLLEVIYNSCGSTPLNGRLHRTAVGLTLVIMDFDVTLLYLASIGTMLIRAELLTSVHRLWLFCHSNQILPDERFYFNSEALFTI